MPRISHALFLAVIAFAFAPNARIGWAASAAMVPMEQIGPQSRKVDPTAYAHVIRVAPGAEHPTVAGALSSINDASSKNRYAVLVAAGTYHESRIAMKPHVDLYGGFVADNWNDRDVYQHATIVDARSKGPVVVAADDARLDGFVITGGEHPGHGAGIICRGTSPTIVNNVILGNRTLKPEIGEGLGKQIAHEGAGIALLEGSRAYVSNNLICENSTEVGNGAGITARGDVQAKILRNVFCNNTAGTKDDTVFHGKVGSRSSPGGAIACSEHSSPQISFNVIVLCAAVLNNDAGGIWVEGNSMPPINYNWIVGNTSGDDGGGIYVMGDLYYDEQGVRHDSSPDGPVSIEDNLIAGNHTVRGGPGGVRVSRWGRVDLRRNQIVGNDKGGAHGGEGGLICAMENNIIADNGAKREPARPAFRLVGDIAARKFDARYYVTEIGTTNELSQDLSGSVVRIGTQWSVVKSSGPSGLTVWGKIADDAVRVEVLDDYGERAATTKSESFDRDPAWIAQNNHIVPEKFPTIEQNFGYSQTGFAGRSVGEMGGQVTRASEPAYYADRIKPQTLDDKLSASGTFALTKTTPGGGVFFGFFRAEQPGAGGRPVSSLGLNLDGEHSGGRLAVRLITGQNQSCGTFITPFLPGKFRPTPIRDDGTRYTWKLDYDPQAADGRGRFTFSFRSLGDRREELSADNLPADLPESYRREALSRFPNTTEFSVDLPAGYKQQGTVFDRFGLMNMMKAGGAMKIYFDDLEYTGRSEDFTDDPHWDSSRNRVNYQATDVGGAHNFGFSDTNYAGGRPGEIGGTFWRSGEYGYYADRVGPLSLDDRLEASGKVVLKVGAPDSDMYLGWFSSSAKSSPSQAGDFLGVHVGGPTRIGHYFQPAFATSKATKAHAEKGPVLQPNKCYEWSLVYDPTADGGQGIIQVTLGEESVTLALKPGWRDEGARFDRFGLFTSNIGGQVVKIYFDDLTYMASRPSP